MTGLYEENPALLHRAREGDEGAFEELVSRNMGLVKRIAARFRDRGTEYEDLVQIGVIGMMKAIRSFDPAFGTAFSTYAVPLIIGEIKRHLRDDGMIKVGRSIKKAGGEVMRERERFVSEMGREPRTLELAERCGMTAEELVYALEAVSPIRSLSEPQGEEDGLTLEHTLAQKEDDIERITDRIALNQAIDQLPPLQRQLIILRYYRGLSQQQTGNILGMTQVKVSREEKKIMEKLRGRL